MSTKMRSLLLLALLPTVAWAGARASNVEKGGKLGANFWAPTSAIDGKLDTAWMVPGESPNRGEWIEIDVPQGDIDKISIFPGFDKSAETFTDYPRVKQMRVDVFALDDDQQPKQVGTATIDVADKAEWQTFDIPDIKIAAGLFGGKVRLSVMDIYDGEDYPNLAISEVLVNMKEFDAKVKVTDVSGETAGHERANMLDDNPKTFFAVAGTTATLSLESAGFGLSSLNFVSAGKDYARPKTVEITAGGNTTTTVLADKPDQWAQVPAFNGYTGGAFGTVEVKIVDVYPGAKPELGIGVTELKARATNFEAL